MDLDDVADELYGMTPEQFTPARNARAKEAKAGGDKDLAGQILALRKPNSVAWLANSLARQRPDEIGPLLDLGEALREASATLSGPELRELSRQRHQLVYAMVQEGRAIAAETGRRVTEDVARGLEQTLTAALADADDGELLRRARLTEGLVPGGFPVGEVKTRPKPAARPVSPPPAAARPKSPSGEERRLAERKQRIERDLVAAFELAQRASAAQDETSAAFDEAQRALTEAELGLADLRAELDAAEKVRDQAKRDSEKAQTADERARRDEERAQQRVDDLQSRLDDL